MNAPSFSNFKSELGAFQWRVFIMAEFRLAYHLSGPIVLFERWTFICVSVKPSFQIAICFLCELLFLLYRGTDVAEGGGRKNANMAEGTSALCRKDWSTIHRNLNHRLWSNIHQHSESLFLVKLPRDI